MPEIKTARWYHDRIIDMILESPVPLSQNEIARQVGYSATWVSIMVNSDAFKHRLEERKAELIDPVLAASLNERLDGIAMRALDKIAERLDSPGPAVKTMELVAIAKLAVGDKNTRPAVPPSTTQNNFVFQLPAPAQNSQEWLARAKPVEVIENGS